VKKAVSFIVGCVLSLPAFCDQDQMKITLVKMVNQLEAMKPLITEAERQQSENPRIVLHFEDWTDSEGELHHGFRTDLEAMQTGLLEIINQEDTDPRSLPSLKGDFVGGRHV
jgi:RAQPRD family integrative conjugative element protein